MCRTTCRPDTAMDGRGCGRAEENAIRTDERLQLPQMVAVAADLTRYLLDSDPDRLAHSQAVARRAEVLNLAVEPKYAPLLVAAAWLLAT